MRLECRRSSVATLVTPSRSAIVMRLAAVSPSGKSAYCSTSSAMRSESVGLRSTGTNSPAANSRKNATSARAASSGLKHVADLCRHSGRHEQFLGCRAEQLGAPRCCGSLTAPAGARGPESTKITGRAQPARSLQCVLPILASLLVKLPTRASHAELRFLAPLFVMRSSLLSGFRLGAIALFLSAADGHWPHLYCVGSGILWVNHSLTSGSPLFIRRGQQ
jgi:hypothetical protein